MGRGGEEGEGVSQGLFEDSCRRILCDSLRVINPLDNNINDE